MKKIGIIAAQEEEIAPLRDRLCTSPSLRNIIFLEVSGVGMLNAMISTHRLIQSDYVDMIVNIGVSAGRGNNLHIGDLVSVNRVYNGDFDISVFDHPKYYMPLAGDYLTSQGRDKNLKSLPCFSISQFLQGNIETPISDYVVDMEYYGIAYTCKKLHIPTRSIKCISDTDIEHSAEEYESMLQVCSDSLADYVVSHLGVL